MATLHDDKYELEASGATVRFDTVILDESRRRNSHLPKYTMCVIQPVVERRKFVKDSRVPEGCEVVQIMPTWEMLWWQIDFLRRHDPEWPILRGFLSQSGIKTKDEWKLDYARRVRAESEGDNV